MNQVELMRFIERAGDLIDQVAGLGNAQGAFGHELFQIHSFDVFHDEEMKVVDTVSGRFDGPSVQRADNVVVTNARQGAHLGEEALQHDLIFAGRCLQNLDGDGPPK